ncbi:hypothetical protein LguiA_029696 [Lonicera macranthoides]
MFSPRFNLVLRSTFRQSSRRSALVWMGILVHSTPLSLKFTFSSHKICLSSNSNSYSAPKKNNPIRIKIKLHIKITAVDYNKNSSAIRVKGKSLFSNEHVRASVFHTLEIKNKEFNLVKQNWDEDSINSLAEASNRTNRSYLAVVLMQEGLAHIFSVDKTLTVTLFSIDRTIGANKFFEMIFSAFNKHVDFDREQCYKITTGTILGQLETPKVESRHCQINAWLAAATNRERRLVEVRKNWPGHPVGNQENNDNSPNP